MNFYSLAPSLPRGSSFATGCSSGLRPPHLLPERKRLEASLNGWNGLWNSAPGCGPAPLLPSAKAGPRHLHLQTHPWPPILGTVLDAPPASPEDAQRPVSRAMKSIFPLGEEKKRERRMETCTIRAREGAWQGVCAACFLPAEDSPHAGSPSSVGSSGLPSESGQEPK